MVRPRQVERVVAAHAVPTRQDIDFRVIEHVPDVQRARNVRWGNHDREDRPRRLGICAEERLFHPVFGPVGFNLLRFVGFRNFARHAKWGSCLCSNPRRKRAENFAKSKTSLYGRREWEHTRHYRGEVRARIAEKASSTSLTKNTNTIGEKGPRYVCEKDHRERLGALGQSLIVLFLLPNWTSPQTQSQVWEARRRFALLLGF